MSNKKIYQHKDWQGLTYYDNNPSQSYGDVKYSTDGGGIESFGDLIFFVVGTIVLLGGMYLLGQFCEWIDKF